LIDRKANKFLALAKMQSCFLPDLWYQVRMHVSYAGTAATASGNRSSCRKHAKERKRSSRIVHHCRSGVSRKCITFTCTSPYRLEHRFYVSARCTVSRVRYRERCAT